MNSIDLKLIFWETTQVCNLSCPHCRASAAQERSPLDLSTEEAKQFIDSASSFSKPILVFSGGEPLLREDIYELAEYTISKGLTPTLATNATLITDSVAKRLKNMRTIAVSIYGASKESHDNFCGEAGAFEKTLAGIKNIKKHNIPLQINTTITKKNLDELEAIYKFALEQKASAYHVFFLVPTGRGKSIEGDEISPQGYEEAFNRLYEIEKNSTIRIKATCAPHYHRILALRPLPGHPCQSMGLVERVGMKGCLAGTDVCFISHKGEVFGCGYLPVPAGDLRKEDFKTIWYESKLFSVLRDDSKLKGKCAICEFKKVCGGCRARAFAATGDYLDEEPYCAYDPLLNRIQNNFPLATRPYKILADKMNLSEEEVFNKIKKWVEDGVIRRIGANFNSHRLGYKSTLIAMKVPDERLEVVASIVNKHNGVTHNYLRKDTYNLWFTLIGDGIDKIKEETGIMDILDLPVTRQFKINASFNLQG